jgi:hypothetical protein
MLIGWEPSSKDPIGVPILWVLTAIPLRETNFSPPRFESSADLHK